MSLVALSAPSIRLSAVNAVGSYLRGVAPRFCLHCGPSILKRQVPEDPQTRRSKPYHDLSALWAPIMPGLGVG